MQSMLTASVLTTAEGVINRLLQRDPVTLNKLATLQGKRIMLRLTSPELNILLLPNSDGLQLQTHIEDEADTSLSGNSGDFIRLLSSRDKADAMFGNSIQISGDSQLAQQLQQILADAHIDWEAILADLIGDLPGHSLSQLVRWKVDSLRLTGSSLLLNLQEYIQEEAGVLPTRIEADIFADEVDQLQERVDRLAARVQTLPKSQ